MASDELESISIIMVGDASVGKTTLMKRFITVRMWEETKDKLEQVRIDKSMKEKKKLSSLAR